MKMRMKDVARDLGLSAVTVSKVLHNHPDISEETRKRVLKRVKELNYQPNIAARSLITGQTWTMGLIVPDLLQPFFAQLALVISREIREKGYSLLISSSENNPEKEQNDIAHLLSRQVDCLLIASTQWQVSSFRQIEAQMTPYILLDRHFAGLTANFIGIDDHAVGLLATRHLLQQGCKRIAHVRGPAISTAYGRLVGYQFALQEADLPFVADNVVTLVADNDSNDMKGGYLAMQKLLDNPSIPDGVFCYNDSCALGVMRALQERGLHIPEDVAVIGCGNLFYSDFLHVPLSSVDQGGNEVGLRAAHLALQLATEKIQTEPQMQLIHPQLIIRESSRRESAA